MAISRRQAYPHWHPEAFDEPCQHDTEPGLEWPTPLIVTMLAAGLAVMLGVLWALVTAL